MSGKGFRIVPNIRLCFIVFVRTAIVLRNLCLAAEKVKRTLLLLASFLFLRMP